MNWQETKQMNNKHKDKIKLAKELMNKKGLSAQRAAEFVGLRAKEIERVEK